ncbi:hypothetical protein CASFOL_009399 [Castilleja foliolosa]|uniref:Uncharacterized protein n=1 Tax=Castilleja foliolosa TaxID=1961234 RepID=A0ABD3E185_9LAMI
MGGLRGSSSLASWVVAGNLAYILWVRPSQQLRREQEEKAALAASDPNRYIEKRKPIPDPQGYMIGIWEQKQSEEARVN